MKTYYDPSIFEYSWEGVKDKDYIIATYYIEDFLDGVDFLDHLSRVQEMVLEGSTGSWIDIKEETPGVREKLSGKLLGYYEVPAPKYGKRAIIQLAFPTAAWDLNANIPMMLLSVAGNIFVFSKKVRVLDISFPESLIKKFSGPKFGIDGLRKLTGVQGRPLLLHIIKPKMGMTAEETANQVYLTALGGADFAKDDEMCSTVFNCSMEDRLTAVLKAVEKAKKKTGRELIYFVSITDDTDRIVERAKRAVEIGAKGLLVSYPIGFSALKAITSNPDISVPVLLHPSNMLGLIPTNSYVFLAKMARLCGADILLGPSYWGATPPVTLEESIRWTQVVRSPLYGVKPMMPTIGGGAHPGLAEIYIKEVGINHIIASGGGLLGHPEGYTAGARAWRQAIDSVVNDVPLEKAAEKHIELCNALKYFGYYKRPRTPWLYISPEFTPKVFKDDDIRK